MHEYVTLNGPVHHLDLYRLTGREDEALDMGLDYYLNESPYYCFVEWGSIVPTLWPERYLLLTLEVLPNAARQVSLTPNP